MFQTKLSAFPKDSRRRFLQLSAAAAGASFLPSRLLKGHGSPTAADPFDALPKSVWQRARNNGLVMIRRPAPTALSSRVTIVDHDEPGAKMIVSGQVFAPDGVTPAEGITVYAYNTDAAGYYGKERAEYPPRLYGWMKTDAEGRFELSTVRPGPYPNMKIPAHVHFTVWGVGYPPQWAEELRFAGDDLISTADRAMEGPKGRFSSIQPLTGGSDGVWHCSFCIKLERETNFR
jgi:protocatechuate 3,4-dioxygenase beta subunit